MAKPAHSKKNRREKQLNKGRHPLASAGWVRLTLRGMSLEEKLGQLLVLPFWGDFPPNNNPEFAEAVRAVERLHVGGFMLHTRMTPSGLQLGRARPTAEITNALQAKANVPLLFAADFERGTAMRLADGTSFPHAMAVAAAHSSRDAHTIGRTTAIEARAAGIQWVFAPDSDVNSNPANPIINTRSFGEDAKSVAKFVSEFVGGLEENGALATAKHFPGHGDTSVDSHLGLPRISADAKRLDKVELVPFRAAISAAASAIMTGHLSVPALEPDQNVPATLSRNILTGLLRKKLGFRGLLVTDALDMAGAGPKLSPGEIAVRAVVAGADVLLLPPAPDEALAALKDAVAAGRITEKRIDESVARILRAKAKVGLHRNRYVEEAALESTLRLPRSLGTARDIAERGVTLLRDDGNLIPLEAARQTRVLLVTVADDPDPNPGETFEREVRWRAGSVSVNRVDTKFSQQMLASFPSPETYDVAIAAIFVRVADRKGSVGLPEEQARLVERLIAQAKPTVVVCFGSPYLIERFPKAKTWLAAFSTSDVAQSAAARALFGQVGIAGKIPVSVPSAKPPIRLGHGLKREANSMTIRSAGKQMSKQLAHVHKLLKAFVSRKAFPGGVLGVVHRAEVVLQAFGRQTYEASSKLVAPDTIYDIASLTKPVVTATLVAMEVETGRLSLDAPISSYLPEWNAGPQPLWRQMVTLRHLLTHTSGLPGHVFYYESARTKQEVISRALSEKLNYEPGSKCEYSDPGFILLGEILERATGLHLNDSAANKIFGPIGMANSMFNPPSRLRARIAPTGMDSLLRKRMLRGEVHDDNAWVMGGVAGHAGLFSTARDLSIFCRVILNGGIYAHKRYLRYSTVYEFTSPQALSGNTRTLGWAMRTEPSSSGRYFSARSFGHAGFTGTSIWCDPEKDLAVVLLTNRVYPTRENDLIHEARPAIHDAVCRGLGLTRPGKSSR
ncbi:MAG TPA: glycoside hydrolase family 3 N-terminal domain-containing protein [Candidatus Acidoferrum sp.]|nr:glycoside hydrolase family 3 N-terminal domain-containing protein [Candidatus Acidoferrum sp.]